MARLISVNVGLPRDIVWKGRVIHTGIWKNPVPGRCRVGRLESGRRRSRRLGRPRRRAASRLRLSDRIVSLLAGAAKAEPTSSYGQFGENFTIEGLPDDAVCIGDRYQIGSALFEVTQPRVTCYRVGIRMNEPADAGVADIQRTAGVLLPRSAGRRGRCRRRNRESRRGEGANDRRGDQRAPLFAQSCARSAGARVADRGAFARMARVV